MSSNKSKTGSLNATVVGVDFSLTSPAAVALFTPSISGAQISACVSPNLSERFNSDHVEIAATIKPLKFIRAHVSPIVSNLAVAHSVYEFVRSVNPDYIVVEGLAFNAYKGTNLPVAFRIIESTGILKGLLTDLERPIYTIPPTSVKKEFAGSGRATKEDMRKAFDALHPEVRLPNHKASEDIVDAFAIAYIFQQQLVNGLSKSFVKVYE